MNPTSTARELRLALTVTDPDVVAELSRHEEGPPRDEAVRLALRIGILALRQAAAHLDADIVRQEGERAIHEIRHAIAGHGQAVVDGLRTELVRYFDPATGALPQRIERLVRREGDLDQAVGRLVAGEGSELARTLAARVGAESPLLKALDPNQKDGLLAALEASVTQALAAQRDAIVAQFSLDVDDSALSRLRRELMDHFDRHQKTQGDLLAEIKAQRAYRQAADRSTLGGREFEDRVGEFLRRDAERLGDVFEAVGTEAGDIPRCKVGDHVVTLGAESAAPGARVVSESKAQKTSDVAGALAEIETARRNRKASAGLFVFEKSRAPAGLDPLVRHGQDVLVTWDSDDPASDVYLRAGLSLARALAVRERAAGDVRAADLDAIEKAVETIARQAADLEDIRTKAATVVSSGEHIGKAAKRVLAALEEQVAELRDHVGRLRTP